MSEIIDSWQAKNISLTMAREQVQHAVSLSEVALEDFAGDAVDWSGSGEHSSIVRHVSGDGRDALVGSRLYRPAGENRLMRKRYLLELGTGTFTAIPDNEMIRSNHGRNRRATSDGDWHEFMQLLENGAAFAKNLRALEQKSGRDLGRRAVIDWDDLPSDE